MNVRQRLVQLGIELPPADGAKGAYSSINTVGRRIVTSGHGPLVDGTPAYVGCVPRDLTIEEATDAARLTAINLLATLAGRVELDRIRLVSLTAYVRASEDFTQHTTVVDGASRLLMEVLGAAGAHSRCAVGVASLPFGIPVEIALECQVTDGIEPARA